MRDKSVLRKLLGLCVSTVVVVGRELVEGHEAVGTASTSGCGPRWARRDAAAGAGSWLPGSTTAAVNAGGATSTCASPRASWWRMPPG